MPKSSFCRTGFSHKPTSGDEMRGHRKKASTAETSGEDRCLYTVPNCISYKSELFKTDCNGLTDNI